MDRTAMRMRMRELLPDSPGDSLDYVLDEVLKAGGNDSAITALSTLSSLINEGSFRLLLEQQAQQQFNVGANFRLVQATPHLELHTNFGVLHLPLPQGEFWVFMEAAGGCRRFGTIKVPLH